MTARSVQVCSAATQNELQQIVGAALAYWTGLGFTHKDVEYVSPGEAMASVQMMTAAGTPPTPIWSRPGQGFIAVIVVSNG